jgi:hypothetical protein
MSLGDASKRSPTSGKRLKILKMDQG